MLQERDVVGHPQLQRLHSEGIRHMRTDPFPTLSRRTLLLYAGAIPLALLARELNASEDQLADPTRLKPGEFAWHPERSPEGPVVIIVSIPDQWVAVYRNGKRIAVSTCSTGRPGHATPTGTFVILQKDVNHHSSLYNDAPMPYMERVTWGGVALHAGQLPGYPASHGCVRLPKEFSRLLFTVTHVGTAVIIADRQSAPEDVLHPGLLISEPAGALALDAVAKAKNNLTPAPTAKVEEVQATSIIIHTADKRMRALVNGKLAFEDDVTIKQPELPFGTHVFSLVGPSDDPAKMQWMAVEVEKQVDTSGKSVASQASALLAAFTINRVVIPDTTAHRLTGMLHPGATMIITDQREDPARRTDPGFTIMAQDDT
jgi:hypothetical protein